METLINNPDVQEIAISVAALLASIAFSAIKGTEIYRATIQGREDRIMQYIETGARAAYSAYVRRIKRQKGTLSPVEARTARDMAIAQATEAARERGDGKLLANLTDRELEGRLEAILQQIKAEAAMGEAARAANRTPNGTGGLPLNGFLIAGLLALTFTGCASLGLDVQIDPGEGATDNTTITITPGKYESEAMQAWAIWDSLGESGELPDHPRTTPDADRAEAFRYASALSLYAIAQVRSRKPTPGIAATMDESARCVAWYLRQAHPHVEASWSELYRTLRGAEEVPERLRPLFEYVPE